MKDGKIDRPDEPKGPNIVKPVTGSAVPKAGKRFGGPAKDPGGDEAPQGA